MVYIDSYLFASGLVLNRPFSSENWRLSVSCWQVVSRAARFCSVLCMCSSTGQSCRQAAFSGILARQDFSDPSVFQPHGFEVDCPGNYSESLPDA
ncbi:MAG: hypothetical protein ACOVRM_17545, partial [Planctomycetaceae bacterium]